MKIVVHWAFYGTIREIYLHGYRDIPLNTPPLLYMTWVPRDALIRGVTHLADLLDDYAKYEITVKMQVVTFHPSYTSLDTPDYLSINYLYIFALLMSLLVIENEEIK